MFDYLQKYNSLPKELRDKVSTPKVMSTIENLEKKYGFSLAAVVMKVLIKDININDLVKYLIEDFKLGEVKSKQLSNELKEKIFAEVSEYLEKDKTTSIQEKDKEGREKKDIDIPQVSTKPNVQGPGFYLSPEDEKEILDLTKKINGYTKDSMFESQVEKKLDKIISKIQVNFGSKELSDRFRRILKTYLSGIRDRLEAKQTLIKPIESGGLSFDTGSAEKVLSIVDGDIKDSGKDINIKIPKKIGVLEDKLIDEKTEDLKRIGVRDVEYDLSSLKKTEKKPTKLDTEHELAPPPPRLWQKSPPAPSIVEEPSPKLQRISTPPPRKPVQQIKTPEALTEKKDLRTALFKPKIQEKEKIISKVNQEEIKPISTKAAPEYRVPIQIGGKTKMEDVKFQPKIMGPIDELRYMDLINFRRLNEDPFKAVDNIKEKIDMLEEYSRKLEGIKAWRLSPVNKLYLKIGEASISNRKPINDIIRERKSSGKDYLNEQEFEAIIRLNKELRF